MRQRKFLLILLSFLIIEAGFGFVMYRFAAQAEQQSLLTRVQTVAGAFDAREITQLAGNESDSETPAYRSLKQRLVRIGKVNADVVSVYVTGYRDGRVFFYADSVDNHEVGEATPGLLYEEATPLFVSVFTEGKTIFEGPLADRWGEWVSAIAPIVDENAAVVASIGMDLDASAYRVGVITKTAVPVLLLGILFLIAFILYIRYSKNRELLELKSRFVSIASHELRSPVAGIVWAAQSLQHRAGALCDDESRQTMLLIEQAGKQLGGTVEEILNFSRLASAEHEKFKISMIDLAALVRTSVRSLALVAQQMGVVITTSPSWPLAVNMRCDSEKTKRVLLNLLTNALKYSRRGGRITIGYSLDAHGHHVSVADEGVGIPKSEQEKIFKPDFRASNVDKSLIVGSGLGLYFARKMMEEQGGALRFTSHEGKGSIFYMDLPDRQA